MQRFVRVVFMVWVGAAFALLLVGELARVAPVQFWYYPALLGGIGLPLWRNRDRVATTLQRWRLPQPLKFLLLGYGMVLTEEILAALFNHLSEGFALPLYVLRIGQFWALNVLAFTGFIVGWYLVQRWWRFTHGEVFFLAGVWGLYAEHTYLFVLGNPIAFVVLAPLNILTYGVILTPALLSLGPNDGAGKLHPLLRYPLTFVTLFACSLPPIIVLGVLRAHFPDAFPPRQFVP